MNKNMYSDSKKQWNCFVGCKFDCVYCIKSFKAQMKRQKHNCIDCYNYEPHFHWDRLYQKLPLTYGDEFIWVGSSGDMSFCEKEWMLKILKRISEMPERTFFFQTKNPSWFNQYSFPENCILGITLESNRDYREISKAPLCRQRAYVFAEVNHPRKSVTIEPVLKFDLYTFMLMIIGISPERVKIGYDTKKCKLPEPSLSKVKKFIVELEKITNVKEKLIREAWDKS